jgi:hypothetical protein
MLKIDEFCKNIGLPDLYKDVDGHIVYVDYLLQNFNGYPENLKFDYQRYHKDKQFGAYVYNRMKNKDLLGLINANVDFLMKLPIAKGSMDFIINWAKSNINGQQ